MMMKGSSSTFLSALLGLTIILCVVKEGHGWKCYRKTPDQEKEIIIDCKEETSFSCGKGLYKYKPYRGCTKEKDGTKSCACSTASKTFCQDGGCFCQEDLCNDDSLSGATKTTLFPLSTLLLALVLLVITSSNW